MQPTTPAEYLDAVRTPSDVLSVADDGSLAVDGLRVADLLTQFGSPLYIACESTLRSNFRRIRQAFTAEWPAPVNVLYAIKANNNPAIRAILHQEGAGGDCFGLGELHITFVGGADPDLIVVNGSSKTYEELEAAVARGVSINVDDEAEVDDLADIARRTGKTVRVNLRLKIVPASFARHGSDYFGVQRDVATHLRAWKWGFSPEAARHLIERIRGTPGLRLTGYSAHSGRVTTNPKAVGDYAEELGRVVAQLAQATGFKPAVLDIGGGWPRQRDPESRSLALNPRPIEAYAREATHRLLSPLQEAGIPAPQLWLEPGRFIVGNALLLAGRVGRIKRDLGHVWVNADFSTNNVMRVDTSGSAYHILAASGMHRPFSGTGRVVGPTCAESLLAEDWSMPENLRSGEPIVLLDAGMYAETTSTQLNGIPRPATVLVGGGRAEIIKERETVDDVFAKCRVPARLAMT
ncbi:MAG: hypothetical protein AB7S71_05955 [Dongiaceae bacterium]